MTCLLPPIALIALCLAAVTAQFPTWPTAKGNKRADSTISVTGTLDGKFVRYTAGSALGDGGQKEGQKPIFELKAGASLKNVIIGAPAADGIHCLGSCYLENVWWEDVGEDAASFLGSGNNNYTVNTGGARKAHDKVFQHNGGGTVYIKNFQVENFTKFYQACGTCPAMTRKVVMDAIRAKGPGLALVGVMTKNGDTATLTNIQVDSKVNYICQRYNDGAGIGKAGQYTAKQNGDGKQCKYSTGNIKMI
uniref:Probable pectate lyase F n=1 Tax=Ditylenchus dipsaci TaxID=166011 RepID=A0A915DQB4_9BILA